MIARTKLYIVLLLSVLVLIVWALVLGSRPVSSDRTPVRVVIAEGISANQIGQILDESGVIRSPFVFMLTCRMSGAGQNLKPGVYELNRAMSVPEIIRQVVKGEALESWVTIPEGYNVRQIADLLEQERLVYGEAFVRVAITMADEFPTYSFLTTDSLEGYLFPDTYLVARGIDPQGIIVKMLDAFEAKVIEPLQPEIEDAIRLRFGLPPDFFPEGLHKMLTLASLVEREAKIAKDRPLIAAVLWNRLARDMKLQVDATVTYSPGESRQNKDRIYHKDLENGSPYNTYIHHGLPPGPICNPGLESIKATLNPARVDYLYYVARPDGSHVFSRTHEEHQDAKNEIKNSATNGGR